MSALADTVHDLMSMSTRQAHSLGRSLTPAFVTGTGTRHSVHHFSQLSLPAPHTLPGMRARRAARHDLSTSGAGISSPPVNPPHNIPDAVSEPCLLWPLHFWTLLLMLQPIPDSHEGHAFLHDFCMAIPYGMGMTMTGLGSLLFGAGSNGFLVAGLAAALLALTFLSLIQWRARRPSKALTLAQAGECWVSVLGVGPLAEACGSVPTFPACSCAAEASCMLCCDLLVGITLV